MTLLSLVRDRIETAPAEEQPALYRTLDGAVWSFRLDGEGRPVLAAAVDNRDVLALVLTVESPAWSIHLRDAS